MKLLEYEAKQLLADSDIFVPKSQIFSATDSVSLKAPIVLKSQVPTGGRGKAGGIVIVRNNDQIQPTIERLFALTIKNNLPRTLIAEEFLDIKSEYYVSVLVDKKSACIELVAHKNGGVDIETNTHDSFFRMQLDESNLGLAGKELADHFGHPTTDDSLRKLPSKLYECLVKNDATLVEINPLVLTEDKCLVAADCKISLDDAAIIRHPNWNFEHSKYSNNFVTLDENGNVATIANGAGLAMATIDAIADSGLRPANFLDIGGGANSASILEAFQKIMKYQNIKVIIINIFAGITLCDEVARAIIGAKQQINGLPPLYIRLAGTNYEIAKVMLEVNNIPLLDTLKACISAATKEVNGGK